MSRALARSCDLLHVVQLCGLKSMSDAHTHICTRTDAHSDTPADTHTHVQPHTHTHTHMSGTRTRTHTYVHTHTHTHMSGTHIRTHTHVHTHTHTHMSGTHTRTHTHVLQVDEPNPKPLICLGVRGRCPLKHRRAWTRKRRCDWCAAAVSCGAA